MPKMLTDSLNFKNDSWYVRWVFSNYMNGKFSIFPFASKIKNIGFSENATHCHGISAYVSNDDILLNRIFDFGSIDIQAMENDKEFLKYFSYRYKFLFRLKLLFKRDGLKLLFNEIKSKIDGYYKK